MLLVWLELVLPRLIFFLWLYQSLLFRLASMHVWLAAAWLAIFYSRCQNKEIMDSCGLGKRCWNFEISSAVIEFSSPYPILKYRLLLTYKFNIQLCVIIYLARSYCIELWNIFIFFQIQIGRTKHHRSSIPPWMLWTNHHTCPSGSLIIISIYVVPLFVIFGGAWSAFLWKICLLFLFLTAFFRTLMGVMLKHTKYLKRKRNLFGVRGSKTTWRRKLV